MKLKILDKYVNESCFDPSLFENKDLGELVNNIFDKIINNRYNYDNHILISLNDDNNNTTIFSNINNNNNNKYLEGIKKEINEKNMSKTNWIVTLDTLTNRYNTNIPRISIKLLMSNYGTNTNTLILEGNLNNSNSTIYYSDTNKEQSTMILKSQIEYELKHLNLIKPIDFLIKRHNYIDFIINSDLKVFIVFLNIFKDHLNYTHSQYYTEFLRLVAFKMVLTSMI